MLYAREEVHVVCVGRERACCEKRVVEEGGVGGVCVVVIASVVEEGVIQEVAEEVILVCYFGSVEGVVWVQVSHVV